MLCNYMKQGKTCKHFFMEILLFELCTTKKQTINSTYLVSVGCGRLAEGKGHDVSCTQVIKPQILLNLQNQS